MKAKIHYWHEEGAWSYSAIGEHGRGSGTLPSPVSRDTDRGKLEQLIAEHAFKTGQLTEREVEAAEMVFRR